MQRLESSIAGRVLLSVFLAATVAAMVVWNMPDSKLRREGMRLAEPYVTATGLDQAWDVFAPDPYRYSFRLLARITYADGSTGTWAPPRGGALIGKYWDYRWVKWSEWTLAGRHPSMCNGTATYIANLEADEGRTPVKIDLVSRTRDNQPPGAAEPHGDWREIVICTSTVNEAS